MDGAAADASPSFLKRIPKLLASVDEIVSASKAPDSGVPALFAALVERLKPIIHGLQHQNNGVPEISPVGKAVESLDAELRHARSLVGDSTGSAAAVRLIEGSVHSIGRCLGLLLIVWADPPAGIREAIGALHREMIAVEFGGRDILPDIEDLVLRVKKGDDEELAVELSELGLLVREGLVGEIGGNLIQVLVNRLASVNKENRLKIILVLRSLAFHSDENKERMAGIETLSSVVHSLASDTEESREAAGLLLDLSSITKVRQRIGRIQGCIVMLVVLLKGDDPCASNDAGKLLGALSNNTQNVLLMAEAGYLMPLVQYLKEGSDMNKILMATAVSRMELTDEMKASLGEEGSVEPLVKMFTSGKLEAKLSALGALRNLSSLTENIPRLINSGIVAPLVQLLFSVTSVLMTLREPASAILASIAQSEQILKYKDVAQRMLSLLNLSSPAIQLHLLLALNSIAGHSNARRVKARMKENGVIQLLLPFLTESNAEIRIIALNLLFNVSKDFAEELAQRLGEAHLIILVDIISASASDKEKTAAIGILSNLPVKDKKATEILASANLLPLLTSLLERSITSSSPTRRYLLEGIAGVMVRFTVPWDKKLQRVSASHGVIPCLVKLLSEGSSIAKCRAATSLAQLSQNTLTLNKAKSYRWFCGPPRSHSFCNVHNAQCLVKSAFCLVKAGALSPLIQILEGKEREADEAVLDALATLMQDEISENGANAIERESGVQAIIGVVRVGSVKAQEKAMWMLQRIFRIESHRVKYGEAAGVVLVDLARKDDPTLRSMIADLSAHEALADAVKLNTSGNQI